MRGPVFGESSAPFKFRDPAEYRAALYIRLSKEDENDGPSESVTNQKLLLTDFASLHGISVYDVYIDDGWSGTNFDRPGFRRMIRDIEADRVNLVITKDLSRLGRDYILTGHYLERYFPERRVRYLSLLDGIDTGVESAANDITPFRALLNDLYAKDISRKITSVKREKQKQGLFIGGKPVYGYQMHPTEKNRLAIDPIAAPVVRRIFKMALEGQSCRAIAAGLNLEGVPTPAAYCGWNLGQKGRYSGLWSGERISEMLQNETYLGNMVQGKSVKSSYKSKRRLKQPPSEWIVVEGTHEPLIDKETFQNVQLLLTSRRHTRSRTYEFPLKGLIFCKECGAPLAVINRPTAAGETRLFFVCRTYQRFTKAGVCSCHTIKEQTVTDAVLGTLRKVCGSFLTSDRLLPIAMAELQKADSAQDPETLRSLLRGRIARLTARLDQIYLDRLSGLLEEEDFQRIYQKAKGDRAALEESLHKLEEEAERTFCVEERAKELILEFLNDAYTGRRLLVDLIERVELTKEKQILIYFRFRPPEAIC